MEMQKRGVRRMVYTLQPTKERCTHTTKKKMRGRQREICKGRKTETKTRIREAAVWKEEERAGRQVKQ